MARPRPQSQAKRRREQAKREKREGKEEKRALKKARKEAEESGVPLTPEAEPADSGARGD